MMRFIFTYLQNMKTYPDLCYRFYRVLILSIFSIASVSLGAQTTVRVSIRLQNKKKEAVSFATITVVKRSDSLSYQQKFSDSSGIVSFTLENEKQYIVKISSVNYLSIEKGITVNTSHSNFYFTLETSERSMQGVTVVTKKPLMRQEDDKTIVDPENLAASSTTAYEIIEKTPGIFVDQDGNVYLSSNTPATIYINGREMKMSTADIATMLKNLPPNAIERIEILRTPSAKYDASGTGGIVNIVLKKGVKLGLTGSVTFGANQGTYGNQFAGLTLNNNTDTKHSYLNMNYGRRVGYERINTARIFAPDSLLDQDAKTIYPGDSWYVGYGIGYELSKKWEFDLDSRVSLNNFSNKTSNHSFINKISTGDLITDNLTRVGNKGNSFSLSQGVNSKYKIDTSGSEWTNDLSYSYSSNNYAQQFFTDYFVPAIASTGGNGNIDNRRHFITAQSDLKWKLKRKWLVETGVKSSLMLYRSETEYFLKSGNTVVKDNFRTNTYRYNENINAVYLQGSKTISDIVIKFGTRVENTNMSGRQIIPFDTSFNIHRTDLFPYIYLSKKIMRIAGYDLRAYLVYRRTISRPAYEYLNPFPRYIDQYLFETGNPSLRPQFTRNYEANISVDERPLLAIGYNDTKDIFTNVVYQADSAHSIAYRTYDNLGTNKEIYFRALGAIPPGKKYFFVLGVQYNRNFYQGLYQDQPLSFKKGSWTFFTYHSLKLGQLSQITLNGFIRLKGQQQFYELSPFGSLNMSVNRQFMKKKLVATLSMNDIFFTNKNDFTLKQGSVAASGYRQSDTQRFGINLRYNFGIRKKEESQDILNTDSPERSN